MLVSGDSKFKTLLEPFGFDMSYVLQSKIRAKNKSPHDEHWPSRAANGSLPVLILASEAAGAAYANMFSLYFRLQIEFHHGDNPIAILVSVRTEGVCDSMKRSDSRRRECEGRLCLQRLTYFGVRNIWRVIGLCYGTSLAISKLLPSVGLLLSNWLLRI